MYNYQGKPIQTKEVHIDTIKKGDTIVHNDQVTTVCQNNIGHSQFMGKSLFGDSYKSGHKKVIKVTSFV